MVTVKHRQQFYRVKLNPKESIHGLLAGWDSIWPHYAALNGHLCNRFISSHPEYQVSFPRIARSSMNAKRKKYSFSFRRIYPKLLKMAIAVQQCRINRFYIQVYLQVYIISFNHQSTTEGWCLSLFDHFWNEHRTGLVCTLVDPFVPGLDVVARNSQYLLSLSYFYSLNLSTFAHSLAFTHFSSSYSAALRANKLVINFCELLGSRRDAATVLYSAGN